MKIDNGYFYNIEPIIDIEHFVELLLATLAAHEYRISDICEIKNPIRTAKLPPNYKQQIEEIMYNEDLISIEFLQLIDHYQYYENQSEWELSLAENFNKYLKNNNKKFNYNFEFDYIEVKFTEEEINKILKKYDEKTKEIMEYLVRYIENSGLDRYHELTWKEAKRKTGRNYIRTSPTTFGNTYTNIHKEEDKTAHISIYKEII